MAPKKAKQQAEVRAQLVLKQKLSRVMKTEILLGKIGEDQQLIREEQRKLRAKFEEVERECLEVKEETRMIMKQTAWTHFKLIVMFKILKAREAGYPTQAAALTRFLRELVAKK